MHLQSMAGCGFGPHAPLLSQIHVLNKSDWHRLPTKENKDGHGSSPSSPAAATKEPFLHSVGQKPHEV